MPTKEKMIIVIQKRSSIRGPKKHQRTLRSLGLGKIGRSVQHRVDPSIMGMVRSVAHLVEVHEA